MTKNNVLIISIHALREESDPCVTNCINAPIFQSTLSVRRATDAVLSWDHAHAFQSTLSVRRATEQPADHAACRHISIHALREESDLPGRVTLIRPPLFQSTLSVRRATPSLRYATAQVQFQSTLSVRRATKHQATVRVQPRNFNPRSP